MISAAYVAEKDRIPRRVWKEAAVVFPESRKAFPMVGVSEAEAWRWEVCLGNCPFSRCTWFKHRVAGGVVPEMCLGREEEPDHKSLDL